MFEQSLQQLLQERVGEFAPNRLTGGYTNQSYLLSARSPTSVCKIAKFLVNKKHRYKVPA